jgi:geranylgeranyl diphosphate synthase type II
LLSKSRSKSVSSSDSDSDFDFGCGLTPPWEYLRMFVLDVYLKERKALVETALLAVLPSLAARPAVLAEAMRHAVLTGGKRLRPILCLAAGEAAGGSRYDAEWPALAVELFHTYTLVHDDLPCMDNDLVRRGHPTVHAKYGETMGVLAGDALQGLAFELLGRTPEKRPGVVAALVTELGRAAGAAGVVGGQVEDVRFAGQADAATLAYVHQHKTADLFAAAMRMGALAAGGAPETVTQLGIYANHLGIAFQIVDDLLDDGEARAGKPPELSCLQLWTRNEARRQATDHTTAAIAALRGLPGPVEPLTALAERMLKRVV